MKAFPKAWTALAVAIALLAGCGKDSESLVKSAQEYLAKGDTNSAVTLVTGVGEQIRLIRR